MIPWSQIDKFYKMILGNKCRFCQISFRIFKMGNVVAVVLRRISAYTYKYNISRYIGCYLMFIPGTTSRPVMISNQSADFGFFPDTVNQKVDQTYGICS